MLVEWCWDVAELVEYSAYVHEALGLTLSPGPKAGLGGAHL